MKEVEAAARRDRHARLAPAGADGLRDPEIFAAVDDLLAVRWSATSTR